MHYRLLSDAIGRHGGVRPVEQGEGDSVVAAFSRASDAVAAALEAQRSLARQVWPDDVDLRVRIVLAYAGRHDEAMASAVEALGFAEQLGDSSTAARALV